MANTIDIGRDELSEIQIDRIRLVLGFDPGYLPDSNAIINDLTILLDAHDNLAIAAHQASAISFAGTNVSAALTQPFLHAADDTSNKFHRAALIQLEDDADYDDVTEALHDMYETMHLHRGDIDKHILASRVVGGDLTLRHNASSIADTTYLNSPSWAEGFVDILATNSLLLHKPLDGEIAGLNLDAIIPEIKDQTVGTIAFWFKQDEHPTNAGGGDFRKVLEVKRFSRLTNAAANEMFIWLGQGNGFHLEAAFGPDIAWYVSPDPDTQADLFNAFGWNHIALVQDGVEAKLYLNGVLCTNKYIEFGKGHYWFNDLEDNDYYIGKVNVSVMDDDSPDARLDEFVIWNRALSALEIAALHNPPRRVLYDEADVLVAYHFDTDAGPVVLDSTEPRLNGFIDEAYAEYDPNDLAVILPPATQEVLVLDSLADSIQWLVNDITRLNTDHRTNIYDYRTASGPVIDNIADHAVMKIRMDLAFPQYRRLIYSAYRSKLMLDEILSVDAYGYLDAYGYINDPYLDPANLEIQARATFDVDPYGSYYDAYITEDLTITFNPIGTAESPVNPSVFYNQVKGVYEHIRTGVTLTLKFTAGDYYFDSEFDLGNFALAGGGTVTIVGEYEQVLIETADPSLGLTQTTYSAIRFEHWPRAALRAELVPLTIFHFLTSTDGIVLSEHSHCKIRLSSIVITADVNALSAILVKDDGNLYIDAPVKVDGYWRIAGLNVKANSSVHLDYGFKNIVNDDIARLLTLVGSMNGTTHNTAIAILVEDRSFLHIVKPLIPARPAYPGAVSSYFWTIREHISLVNIAAPPLTAIADKHKCWFKLMSTKNASSIVNLGLFTINTWTNIAEDPDTFIAEALSKWAYSDVEVEAVTSSLILQGLTNLGADYGWGGPQGNAQLQTSKERNLANLKAALINAESTLIAKLEENRMWLDRQQVLVNVIREEPSNWYNTALVYAPVSYGWVIENIEIALRASDRDTQYALMNSDISNADAYAQTAAEAASAALELTINLPPQISALQAEVAAAFANGSDEYHHILADATSSTYLAPPSIGALSY